MESGMDSVYRYLETRQQELRDDAAVRRFDRERRRERRARRLPVRLTLTIEWAPPRPAAGSH